ncbi:MAG: endolytic transglycosylase MltG, partial [Myxococcales bacterium]|nr:endolytic transglycosylase MltG [Myxococcales bacterium]
MRRWTLSALTVAILTLVGAAALGTYWVEYRTHPAGPTDVVTIVDVLAGMGFYAVADELGRRRIINRRELLKVLVRLRGVGSELKAGEYELRGSMLPDALVSHLTSGQVVLHPLTIPEGLNLREIAARIEAAGFGSAQAVLDAARAPALRESLGLRDGASLEGYLYPETYSFPKGTKPALVLRSMVDAFKAAYTPDFEARANELEMTRHEVVTLASIIEKE